MGFRYLGFRNITREVFKSIEKITCYLSTHIECVSKTNLELGITEKLFSKDKATVVFNGSTGGVDLKKFNINYRKQWRTELRRKYGIDEKDFVYGFVGRITRDKGINELLEAYFNMNTDAKLFLVGGIEKNHKVDPDLFNKAIKDKNVIFVGNITDVEKYYAAMDVLVLPSYREGFGNVIIEAGVMGTPAIVSNIPGPKDAIRDNETGLTDKRYYFWLLIPLFIAIIIVNVSHGSYMNELDLWSMEKFQKPIFNGRDELWENGLSLLREHFLFGRGTVEGNWHNCVITILTAYGCVGGIFWILSLQKILSKGRYWINDIIVSGCIIGACEIHKSLPDEKCTLYSDVCMSGRRVFLYFSGSL